MARLIQKSGYIQGGRAARYMEYIAKRDGVEVLQSTEPVTKKQMQFLTKLLKDFPDAKELRVRRLPADTQPGYGVCVYCCCAGHASA